MLKRISVIGTVGLPANYGGFETLVEYLTKEIKDSNIQFTIFCSSKSYAKKKKSHNNAKLKYIPLQANGMQSVPYDIVSIIWGFFTSDVMLILGVSGAIALPFIKPFYKGIIICNIDGLEHRRGKWSQSIRKLLKFLEKLSVRNSDVVVTDNKAIQDYVKKEYGVQSVLIAYGADHVLPVQLSSDIKIKHGIPDEYAFKVCRIEPENNIHIILEAFSKVSNNIVIVGNWNNSAFGKEMFSIYNKFNNILLLNPIYDQFELNQIRSNCYIYVHGHSAGGTNPSLVEAMYLGLPILSFDVAYNRYTTDNKAIYFKDSKELEKSLSILQVDNIKSVGLTMKVYAQANYNWELISRKYLGCFIK